MVELSKQQVQFILKDIHQNGIQNEDLALNLLDHICCILEEELEDNHSFETHYHSVFKRFFKKEMAEIEEETQLLLTFQNYYAMKNVMIKSGLISSILFLIGAILKILHLPGAAVLLLLAATVFSLVFLPIFFVFKTKNSPSSTKLIMGSGVLFGIIFCIATLFKIMHWPFASLLWKIGLADLFFLFLPLYFFNGIRKEETKTNTILTSVMILMMGGMLFTLTNLRQSTKLIEAINDNTIHMQHIQSQTDSSANENTINENLCTETKKVISTLIEQLTSTASKEEKRKLSLTDAVYYYGENTDIVIETFFHKENSVSPSLKKLKTKLLEINLQLQIKGQPSLFYTKKLLKDPNWERSNFDHLPLNVVIERLQLLNIELSQRISK